MRPGGLKQRILGDARIRRIFRLAGQSYIVGGYVRDAVRGVRSKDLDFIVRGDIKAVVRRIFPDKDVTVVRFRDEMLIRVVAGETVFDFTELKASLKVDLGRRDFTINALAWSPQSGLVDPADGEKDIGRGIIRLIRQRNLIDDPLRLLRAYRFAGELGWRIEEGTREHIRRLRRRIRSSACERITLEVFKLLNSPFCLKALKMAHDDGLLGEILAIEDRQLADNIQALSLLELFLKKLPERRRSFLNRPFSQGLCYRGLLRAEQLLHRAGMEESALLLSRSIAKRRKSVERALALLDLDKGKKVDRKQLFRIFETAGEGVMDCALLTRREGMVEEAVRYESLRPALTAEEIMEAAHLTPGPEVGKVVREMRRLQYLGVITNKRDAGRWLLKTVEGNIGIVAGESSRISEQRRG